jgi:integrase
MNAPSRSVLRDDADYGPSAGGRCDGDRRSCSRRRGERLGSGARGDVSAGFHTFRHTFASLHLSRGTNLLQLSRALGHHSAAFTLSRYTHLLPGDEAPPLDLDSEVQPAAPESALPEHALAA